MSPVPMKRRSSAGLKAFSLVLCAAVFAWGLQFKLSLYQTSHKIHPVSVAKLLVSEPGNKKSCAIGPGERRAAQQLPAYSAVALFQPAFIVCRNRQVHKLVRSSIPSYPHALLFRPPPSNG
jgi:hypothetical protein